VKDTAGVCAPPKSGLTWGNTVQQEPGKMSKAMSTSTSQRMWWRRRKRTWTRSWARWIREALTISCPGWHSSVYEFSTTTTATRISSNVDYQFCHYQLDCNFNSFGDASSEISWQHKTWINFYKGQGEGKDLMSLYFVKIDVNQFWYRVYLCQFFAQIPYKLL